MEKSVFVIVFDDPVSDETREALAAAYPEPAHYEHSDTVFFVETDHLSKQIREHARMEADAESGVVIRMTRSYSGFTDQTLWEWLHRTQMYRRSES